MNAELELKPLAHQLPRAALISGISRSTLYVLIKNGELKTVKIGRRTLIADSDLRALIERHRGGAPTQCRG
jgi:excisionase family DNA binding protein